MSNTLDTTDFNESFQKLCFFDSLKEKTFAFDEVLKILQKKNRICAELPKFDLKFTAFNKNSEIIERNPPEHRPEEKKSDIQVIPFRPNSRRKQDPELEEHPARSVHFQEESYKQLKPANAFMPASHFLNAAKDSPDDKPKHSNIKTPFMCPLRSSNAEKESSKISTIEEKLVEMIESEIITRNPCLKWDDIAGLEFAKKTVNEVIVWPLKRPDLFKGLRAPPKGLMLFGPPGTGKTMIGKAIASEVSATFFSISASSITSKWVGEGEKLVRVLFALAVKNQPSVIFIDEIDSLLSSRSDSEQDASRRIKTEFLVHLDGVATNPDDRILLIGATNRPEELDSAMQRRLAKRMYIPLPNAQGRMQILKNLLKGIRNDIKEEELFEVVKRSKGYSGSDMKNLCTEACMFPLRNVEDISKVRDEDILPVCLHDFFQALDVVRSSVSDEDVKRLVEWNQRFGSFKFEYEELDT